jgi:OCT family organic cation transporter-like MFS transporter 4/5
MDEILNSINPFGKYQKLSLLLIGLTTILVSMPIYSSIFVLAKPRFKCFYYNPINQTNESTIMKFKNDELTCNIWFNISSTDVNNTQIECKYDKTYYGQTVINEWNLICDKQFLASIPQTIYMVGTFSCFGIGFFSDKFGRKPLLLMLCIFLSLNLSFSQILQIKYFNFNISTKFIIFTISNFFTGCAVASIYSVSIVLSLELTTKKYSTIATNIGLYMYVFGEVIVLIIAYFLRNWHLINTVNAIFSFIVTLLIYFFLEESPRYLEQQKMYHEAYIILKNIAKINKKEEKLKNENEIIQDLMKSSSEDIDFDIKNNDSCLNNDDNNNEVRLDLLNNKKKFKPFNNSVFSFVFSTNKDLIQICLLVYIWFAIQLIYFGISLGNI